MRASDDRVRAVAFEYLDDSTVAVLARELLALRKLERAVLARLDITSRKAGIAFDLTDAESAALQELEALGPIDAPSPGPAPLHWDPTL